LLDVILYRKANLSEEQIVDFYCAVHDYKMYIKHRFD